MTDDNKDLLRFAADYAAAEVDLYALLAVDALTPNADIHRAWRKRSLPHHPDKAGARFDPDTWTLYERARDVLLSPAARPVYDAAVAARLLRRQQRDAMNRERRRFADDLEAREGEARRETAERRQRRDEALRLERERLEGMRRRQEEEEARRAAAAQEEDDLAEARRRVREKREEKARKRLARGQIRANASRGGGGGGLGGPANGAVAVPGGFVVDVGRGEKRMYWELVCDKLRALQAVRDVRKLEGNQGDGSESVQKAEMGVMEAKQRIHDAEVTFQQQSVTS